MPKILIVDDSQTVITFQKMMLREEGYELVTATNGKDALETVKRSPPDLVLMDVMMPQMNGVDCCKHLKTDAATKTIPVIMVTTKGDQTMVTPMPPAATTSSPSPSTSWSCSARSAATCSGRPRRERGPHRTRPSLPRHPRGG